MLHGSEPYYIIAEVAGEQYKNLLMGGAVQILELFTVPALGVLHAESAGLDALYKAINKWSSSKCVDHDTKASASSDWRHSMSFIAQAGVSFGKHSASSLTHYSLIKATALLGFGLSLRFCRTDRFQQ